MEKKYVYSIDGEYYEGLFDSIDDALNEAKQSEQFKQYLEKYRVGAIQVDVAECVPGKAPNVNADYVIEQVGDDAYSEGGEVTDNYLTGIKSEHMTELEEMLSETFNKWAAEHQYLPNWFDILKDTVVSYDYIIKEKRFEKSKYSYSMVKDQW